MATKRRSTKRSNTVMTDVVATVGGLALGKIALPKVVDMIDKNQTLNPQMVKGAGAIGAGLFAMKSKGIVQKVAIGTASGLVLDIVGDLIGISGISGYSMTWTPSTDVNAVAGPYSASTQSPGSV